MILPTKMTIRPLVLSIAKLCRSGIEETPSPLRGTPPIFASFHSAKSEGELALSISDFVDWGTWSVGGRDTNSL